MTSGAARRSALVRLDVGNVRETTDGSVVTLRKSKTDQERAGRRVGIRYGSTPATRPVRAVRAWREGHAFNGTSAPRTPLLRRIDRHGRQLPGRLSDRAVARIVQPTA